MAHMREQHRFLGQVPFGSNLSSDGTTLLRNDEECSKIGWMLELRNQGYSLRQIADELEKASVPTKAGKAKWTHTAVQSILRRAIGDVSKS